VDVSQVELPSLGVSFTHLSMQLRNRPHATDGTRVTITMEE
jgi:hypothetical protein